MAGLAARGGRALDHRLAPRATGAMKPADTDRIDLAILALLPLTPEGIDCSAALFARGTA
ncbi:hypothetical protein ASF53_18295 [Methylobacterium sp. Leaf123]|nr:hypothetical protein ASF53_18295 [Methylobacterium sp. Leaf123]